MYGGFISPNRPDFPPFGKLHATVLRKVTTQNGYNALLFVRTDRKSAVERGFPDARNEARDFRDGLFSRLQTMAILKSD